jgi:putative phosphonate metabolism protein
MRYALYFTPAQGSALARFGAAAIGYDAATGDEVPLLSMPGSDSYSVTAEPRRYGFHATLKAPFRLAPHRTVDQLSEALETFASETPSITIGRLVPQVIGSFIALVPVAPTPDLALLAAECVAAFDGFRGPLTPEDRQKRLAAGLGPRHRALLDRWGYPYVFDTFRFHMTLTGPLNGVDERAAWLEALTNAFADLASESVLLDGLSLMRQDDPNARFRLVARFALTGQRE